MPAAAIDGVDGSAGGSCTGGRSSNPYNRCRGFVRSLRSAGRAPGDDIGRWIRKCATSNPGAAPRFSAAEASLMEPDVIYGASTSGRN